MPVPCHDTHAPQHPSHRGELPRLNRVAGQIDGVRKMIEANRYCPDILIQLRAARAALRTIEQAVLATHLDGCVHDAMQAGTPDERTARIAEMVKLFRRYED